MDWQKKTLYPISIPIPFLMRYVFPVLLLLLLSCAGTHTGESQASLIGTYQLTFETDTADYQAHLALNQAPDGVFCGQLNHQPAHNWPDAVLLTQQSGDSLHLKVGFGDQLTVARSGDTLEGIFYDNDVGHPAQLYRVSDTVSTRIQQMTSIAPLRIVGPEGKRLQEVRWPTPIDGQSFYFANLRGDYPGIMRAQQAGDEWQAELLKGQVDYNLSAMDLAPEGSFMVLHGSPRDSTWPSYGKSDLYYAELNAVGDSFTQITLLPAPINGPSFDIFPALRGDSVVLYCAWNRSTGQGRGDLYEAPLSGPPFTARPYACGALNTPQVEAGPYEDPQQRFIMYHRNTRNPFSPDHLYFAARENGKWEEPVKMVPPINSTGYEFSPRLDPAEEYFYWCSDRRASTQIFRLPVSEVQELRPYFGP